jgi:hypothetical protein
MDYTCPRCQGNNPSAARFCRLCGLALVPGPGGLLGAGTVPHPEPLAAPAGYEPVAGAPDLHFHWEAAWGGKVLLGTETLAVQVFNGGYDLCDVVLTVCGTDENGAALLSIAQEVAHWSRGATVALEIPSWELAAPARHILVTLEAAHFAGAA